MTEFPSERRERKSRFRIYTFRASKENPFFISCDSVPSGFEVRRRGEETLFLKIVSANLWLLYKMLVLWFGIFTTHKDDRPVRRILKSKVPYISQKKKKMTRVRNLSFHNQLAPSCVFFYVCAKSFPPSEQPEALLISRQLMMDARCFRFFHGLGTTTTKVYLSSHTQFSFHLQPMPVFALLFSARISNLQSSM